MKSRRPLIRVFCLVLMAIAPPFAHCQVPNHVAERLLRLNDNGAWSWFMDERAIVEGGKLIVGSVRSLGDFQSKQADPDWGNVEVSVCDLVTGTTATTVLHRHFEQDDHDSPALLALSDGRILALYSKHGQEHRIYVRRSEAGNPLKWGPAMEFLTPGRGDIPFRGDNVTYNNLFQLPAGRIYNFFRGPRLDPNYMFSDDNGTTWTYGGRFLQGKGGYSPYLRYAFDGKETVHFIATEDHPRNFDNSVYHGFLWGDSIHYSDGSVRAPLAKSIETTVATWSLTKVFSGDKDNVCWIDDLKLDKNGRPHAVFSVKKDGRGTGGKGGQDIRFHYGWWDGTSWRTHEMAHAGSRLYAYEADYTGLAALDRHGPGVVYFSTNADPVTGKPLISAADGRRHHELFRGSTPDGGKTWGFEPITANSTMDNLRPIVPKWNDARTAVVWMRGVYRHNRGDWATAVVATILPPVGNVGSAK